MFNSQPDYHPANQPDTHGTTRLRGYIHIDRVTVAGPLEHAPIGPTLYKSDPAIGIYAIGSQAYKPKPGKNKAPDDIFARSELVSAHDGRANKFKFDCCPPHVLQAHNVFGSNDLAGCVYEVFTRQLVRHELIATEEEHSWWRDGDNVDLTELHLTGNHACDPNLKPLIFTAVDENNATGKYRVHDTCISLGHRRSGTSRDHTLTLYDKFILLSQEWENPGPIRQELLRLAKNSLRVEIKLHAEWLGTYCVNPLTGEILNYKVLLKKDSTRAQHMLRLSRVSSWKYVDIDALFYSLLARYNVTNSIQRTLTEDEARGLSKKARRAYVLWLKGEDLADCYQRTARSTLTKEIKEATGIDVKARRRPNRLPKVNLAELLVPENLQPVPDCLHGTVHFWTPPNQ